MINDKLLLTFNNYYVNIFLRLLIQSDIINKINRYIMNKIKKVSGYVLWVLNALIFFLPLTTIVWWMLVGTEILKDLAQQGFVSIIDSDSRVDLLAGKWNALSKFLGCVANFIDLLPLLIGLFCLRKIFSNYKAGKIFNVTNAKQYHRIGWLLFLKAFLGPISGALTIWAATMYNLPGHRVLKLSFGTDDMKYLFYGTLILVISWVMHEASKIENEQKFTI